MGIYLSVVLHRIIKRSDNSSLHQDAHGTQLFKHGKQHLIASRTFVRQHKKTEIMLGLALSQWVVSVAPALDHHPIEPEQRHRSCA
jgi:hypothetical protein